MDLSFASLTPTSRLCKLHSFRGLPSAPGLLVRSAVPGSRFFLNVHPFATTHTSPAFYNLRAPRLAIFPQNPRLFSNMDASRPVSDINVRSRSNLLRKSSLMEESTIDDSDIGAPGGQGPPHENRGGREGGDGTMGRILSAFIFAIWAAFLAYCFLYSPNQTPSLDQYFLQRLLFLKADEGYQMNPILVSLWYIMGVWPAIYAMLLIPSGRSSKGAIPVWPFTILSCFVGAFALLPYFGLWRPPAPAVSKEEVDGWPLKLLDSKILSLVLAVAGVSLIGVAFSSGDESWKEFLQYFNSSRFIHVMSLDFLAMSSLAPFWIYNDMEFRKWSNQTYWRNALALIPFLGPALYLILRPSLAIDDVKNKS